MKTVDDLIQELQLLSEEKRKLPIVVEASNKQFLSPTIKLFWDNPMDTFEKSPDKVVISWNN
jgi:hypothetical protein